MNERFDWNTIPTATIKKNIRILSKEHAHLKNILEPYKMKNDMSSFLLSDLEGLFWGNRIILDSQIRVLRKRQGGVVNYYSDSDECQFHGENNYNDPRRAIVKIDVKDANKAIDHLEEIIKACRNRKHFSPGLFRMFEYFLSEYREMIKIKSSKKIREIARTD